jgi:hypothetical protein
METSMAQIPAFLERKPLDYSVYGISSKPAAKDSVANAIREIAETGHVQVIEEAPPEIQDVPPVYVGGVRLVDWGATARGGMTIELLLRDVGPREVNPFKGLKHGKSNGQRLKSWVGPYSEALEVAHLEELECVYSGESLLLFYGDTCTKGVTVKVLLDSGPDGVNGKHPFDGMAIGSIEGADLFCSFWLINDDETLVSKKAVRKRIPFHQLSEVRQANLVVKDEEFINFLSKRIDKLLRGARPDILIEDGPSEWATEVVRMYLGVESRSVMNDDTIDAVNARKRWKTLMSYYHQSDEFNERRQSLRKSDSLG